MGFPADRMYVLYNSTIPVDRMHASFKNIDVCIVDTCIGPGTCRKPRRRAAGTAYAARRGRLVESTCIYVYIDVSTHSHSRLFSLPIFSRFP